MDSITKNTAKNTLLLYMLTMAKVVFPLLTLPYLTRVLSVEGYGVTTYVKSCMVYLQIIVDFGFLFSAVKDIVNCNGNKKEIGQITGEVFFARLLLGVVAIIAGVFFCIFLPILQGYTKFTLLSVLAIAVSSMLLDYLFRGIEKMHVLTIVFVVMKGVSTLLTFVFVKGDGDLLAIPILDIIGTMCAVIVSFLIVRKYGIKIKLPNIKNVFIKLKDSAIYFVSGMATTVFTALTTLLIGIYVADLEQIAFWGISIQLINAVLSLYDPIMKGVHPQMVKHKNLKFIGKMLCFFVPIVLLGCCFCYFHAKPIISIISGKEYVKAVPIFRGLTPIMFISFLGMLFGWPTLGAIGKEKHVTISTITAAVFQTIIFLVMIIFGIFTIPNVIIVRILAEIVLMAIRMGFLLKNKKEFNGA